MTKRSRCVVTAAFFLTLPCLTVGCVSPVKPSLEITDLRCEYRTRPLGIDAAAPRLSWILESEVRGASSSAYHLLVARSRASGAMVICP